MIFRYEVEELLEKYIKNTGITDPRKFVLYADKDTRFDADLYPVEIMIVDRLPKGVACLVGPKEEIRCEI